MDHELATLEQYIETVGKRFQERRRLRESNCLDNIKYPNEYTLSLLDSSIKKNSAFVKRLKVFSESQKEQILGELDRLNLTKFVSEIATSIIEAKLKLSDIPTVIEICSKLNQTYREFSKQLLDQYIKYFPTIKRKNDSTILVHPTTSPSSSGSSFQSYAQVSSPVANKNSNKVVSDHSTINLSKMRVDLRLFAELVSAGIFPLRDGFPVLMNLICYMMVYDKNCYQNASAILTFCKGCGEEFLGLVPKSIEQLACQHEKELPATSDLIPQKRQEQLKSFICDYYQSLLKHFNNLYEELIELVARNKRVFKSKGEITKDSKELVDIKHSECQKAQNILHQLGELLGEDVDNLPDLDALKGAAKEKIREGDTNQEAGSSSLTRNLSIWDDEGAKSFYEDLLDLKTFFPNLTVKVSREKSCKAEINLKEESCDSTTTLSVSGDTNDSKDIKDSNIGTGDDVGDELEKSLSSSSSEESLIISSTAETSSPLQSSSPFAMIQSVANRAQPDQYFTKLSNCVNRDMIDNAAIDFIRFFNTKYGRRKLVKTLFYVQRTRLDLLPFFARLTATINRYVPSIGNELVALLKQDFRTLFRKKDQINIESKVKNVRFIGELVKFDLYSKQEALNCLKLLLSDFTHHHIEMTCNLLETCGRLLYKSPESNQQLSLLLEQMMRKKLLLSVDSKYVTMIENAYYFTNPPEVARQVVEEPQIHTYVRYLLYDCLSRSTIDSVLQKIKKLDWEDKTLAKFVINCMIEAYNLKFYNIRYLAALLAALNKDHQWISIAVIDGVVEDILLMMEINELQFNQRRIPMIRYFGELYNYRLSDSSLVFKILYSLITYGVHYPTPEQTLSQIPMSQLDEPDNLFRIKLVCDLLETCGQYLNSGQEKKKLDCYLLFFQRYYWCKKHIYMLHPYCMAKSGNHFPASLEYLYNDSIFNLRPQFQMATSYAEANQSVQSFIDGLVVNQQPPAQS